ncbi:MAG: T9SS type A sorting domain-containing protein, partial [Bacteroidetes bacterium]|nr:T9SS type A sorting domain-containing protein [Bacteroidota bacterium]
INDANEGSVVYSITSGNNNSYYTINSSTGIITINNTIPDTFNIIHTDLLQISASGNNYTIEIVDGYDYFIENLDPSYKVLDAHKETFIYTSSEWTAYNNLWGKGTAIPNVDFRMATIYKEDNHNETVFLWDTPSKAKDYGGSSVWNYFNIFWGNRKNEREDLEGFPFKINSLTSLNLDFDFEQLFGNEEFKIAMNMFLTNETELSNFSENDGDFFFVFDQRGTWIPPYTYSLTDTFIGDKPFAWRYNIDLDTGYEWRRVIIKDNEKLLSGTLDIKEQFNRFIDADYINPAQSISHIQLGLEVTSGYGAVRFNQADITMVQKVLSVDDVITNTIKVYPNPSNNLIHVNSPQPIQQVKLFSILGELVYQNSYFQGSIDVSNLSEGIYILKIISEDGMHFTKKIIVN